MTDEQKQIEQLQRQLTSERSLVSLQIARFDYYLDFLRETLGNDLLVRLNKDWTEEWRRRRGEEAPKEAETMEQGERASQATRHQLAQGAHAHYERLAKDACCWLSTIPRAIDAWEREPEVVARAERAEQQLAVELAANEELRTVAGALQRNLDVQRAAKEQAEQALGRREHDETCTLTLEKAQRRAKAAWGPHTRIYDTSPGYISVDSMRPDGESRWTLILLGPRDRERCYRALVAGVEAVPIAAEPTPDDDEEQKGEGDG